MNRIRIGIIGAGLNTREKHIPKLQSLPEAEVAAVCNRSRASGERVAREFSIQKVCDHWSEVIRDDSLDAIVIGTWPDMHHLLTCAALDAGKHVLCEARMAMNASEAHEMKAVSDQHPELVAQIVPAPFSLAFDRTIQDLIRDNYLGQLTAVSVRHNITSFLDETAPLTWRQDIDRSGFNTLFLGIYYETIARWMDHALSVVAMSKTFIKQRYDETLARKKEVRVPEHIDVIAHMACGAQASFQFSAVTGLLSNPAEIWIFGSQGTLYLDIIQQKLYGGQRRDAALQEIVVTDEKKIRLAGRTRIH
ncbi:Gfo/Idh/MocA family protein [candidate division CSSED10-310 bacterium]|uniref:Gfo/Idh/MocA family protein n=1 Tax=candidate division CSSED10-310 bacterium TaxID=2855610 RepID=A0ABV6YUP6_UNCC1